MLDIDQIRDRMSDRNVAEVARRMKVTRTWLQYILKKGTKHRPSYHMLERLNDYLEQNK